MIEHKRWIWDTPSKDERVLASVAFDQATGDDITFYEATLMVRGRRKTITHATSIEELEDELTKFRFDVLEMETAEAFWKMRAQVLRGIRDKFEELRFQMKMRFFQVDAWPFPGEHRQ